MARLLVLLLILFSPFSFAQTVPVSRVETLLPDGVQLGLLVKDAKTGNNELALDSDKLLPPASTQKLVTALAAALYLPSDFRFSTQLNVHDNDVSMAFSGDPLFSRDQLRQLITNLKKRNITTIRGDFWLDNSIFTGYERAIGWPWDILGVCYSAPSSAIALDHNCIQGSIYSKPEKSMTRVFVPNHQPVVAITTARAVTKEEYESQHCDLDLLAFPENRYELSGCLVHRAQPLPLRFAVQSPNKYVSDIVRQELKRAGIRLSGQIKIGKPDTKGVRIAQHDSISRDKLLRVMVKDSDNLIADNLLKTIGHHYYQQPGSFRNGTKAVKDILKKEGIDLSNAVMVDGSGLSRNNRMSANQLALVVDYILKHPELELKAMLPVSGIDGTLQYRQSVRREPIKGRLYAKSGSLYGSYNLAGFIENKAQQEKIVIQLVTNYHPVKDPTLPANVPRPITQFERELYQALINQSLVK